MENEQKVVDSLVKQFPTLAGAQPALKPHRIYFPVPGDLLTLVLRYSKKELGFTHLITITGLDNGTEYEFLYHIARPDGILLTVKRTAPYEEPVSIPSILPIYQGATFYEKELEALLGVHVEGLPEGRPYPLPDNWPQGEYPLRKSWTPKQPAKNE